MRFGVHFLVYWTIVADDGGAPHVRTLGLNVDET